MRNTTISFLILISLIFFTGCGLIGATALLIDNADTRKKKCQLEKNNLKFDRDGWYVLNHNFNIDSLYRYIIRQDSLELTSFYLTEEFDFVKNHIKPCDELDTFTCYYPLNSDKGRKILNFSPSKNNIRLASCQQKTELNEAVHCYMKIDANEVACCFITKKYILIPYILIKNDIVCAKPKPYIPHLPFENYKNSLLTIKQVEAYNHIIKVNGRIHALVDTTQRFQQFLKTSLQDDIYTKNIEKVDTNQYLVNHKIQYNFYQNNENYNYYRFEFIKFNNIQDLIQNKDYYTEPSIERYFKPETKLLYKQKLDDIFKKLSKGSPELLNKT